MSDCFHIFLQQQWQHDNVAFFLNIDDTISFDEATMQEKKQNLFWWKEQKVEIQSYTEHVTVPIIVQYAMV